MIFSPWRSDKLFDEPRSSISVYWKLAPLRAVGDGPLPPMIDGSGGGMDVVSFDTLSPGDVRDRGVFNKGVLPRYIPLPREACTPCTPPGESIDDNVIKEGFRE